MLITFAPKTPQLSDSDIPDAIARDSEVASAIASLSSIIPIWRESFQGLGYQTGFWGGLYTPSTSPLAFNSSTNELTYTDGASSFALFYLSQNDYNLGLKLRAKVAGAYIYFLVESAGGTGYGARITPSAIEIVKESNYSFSLLASYNNVATAYKDYDFRWNGKTLTIVVDGVVLATFTLSTSLTCMAGQAQLKIASQQSGATAGLKSFCFYKLA